MTICGSNIDINKGVVTYTFCISVLDKKYTFTEDGDTSIGTALVNIIRDNPDNYLIFYINDKPVRNFNRTFRDVYLKRISYGAILLIEYT